MHNVAYAETLEDTSEETRDRERRAVGESIRLLRLAGQKGPRSREAVEALEYARRLWTVLIEDLGRSDNGLPQNLRASLISIGIWIIKEAGRIRAGESQDFDGLVEISTMIEGGLR